MSGSTKSIPRPSGQAGWRKAARQPALGGQRRYVRLSTGCQWRYLPKDLPPKRTVYDHFSLWNWDGTLDRMHHARYVKCDVERLHLIKEQIKSIEQTQLQGLKRDPAEKMNAIIFLLVP
jgi:transposase